MVLRVMHENPTYVPDSEAFNSDFGDGLLVSEFENGTETSKDVQTAQID